MAESHRIRDAQNLIGDGLKQMSDTVSGVMAKADEKLKVTKQLKEIADSELVKETTSKMMDGVSKIGDMIKRADEKYGVSESISKADQKLGVSMRVQQISEKVGASKAVQKVDNLLGIKQRYDAFMARSQEEEIEAKPAPGYVGDGGMVPPRMRRVESDPTEDVKQIIEDEKVRLVSTGWASGFELNKDHLEHQVSQLFETMDGVSDFDSQGLLKLFDDTEITSAQLDLWRGYNDQGRIFYNKSNARSRLNNVILYCNGSKATKRACLKLKFIASELITKPKEYDPVGILLLLASHGNVCNVMKEVGVDMAYSSITSQNAQLYKSQTLEERIFKMLYEFRIMLVEEIYATFPGAVNNTHSIGMMRNHLAKHIGVSEVLDEHSGAWGLPGNWRDGLVDRYFKDHYNIEKITRWVFLAMNEEPRKIPYDLLIKWLDENSPIDEKYLFFSDTFNVEAGIFKTRYVCWLLMQLGVFTGPEIEWEVSNLQNAEDSPDGFQEKQELKSEELLSFSNSIVQVGKYSADTFADMCLQGVQHLRGLCFAPHIEEKITNRSEEEFEK